MRFPVVRRPDRQIAVYFGILTLASGLGDPTGLLTLPVLFLLKDQLHLGPPAVAIFESVMLLPYYCAFLFGLVRDRWQPLAMGDRGYFVLAAPMVVGCYLWMAASGVDYTLLLAVMLLASLGYQFIDTASQALLTSVAQRHLMTGRLSALIEMAEAAVSIIAMLVGGWMVMNASPRTTFAIAALVTAFIFVQGFWRPRAVFAAQEPTPALAPEPGSLQRLLGHRALRPTILILLLYAFSPGWGTPLFYYLTDDVTISSQAFGAVRAVHYGCAAAVTVLYGLLCVRYPLERLLWWAMVVNIFPGFLFLAIFGAPQAVVVSALVGLVSGFGNVALLDLLMRACPRGLEGSGSMLGVSAFGIGGAIGDLLGAVLYEEGGFVLCLFMDAAATALILPILWRLPKTLIDVRDGEPASAVPFEPKSSRHAWSQ